MKDSKLLSEILFIVQARLGSQRCPRKMIRNFADTTLVDICLEKIKKSIIPLENFYFSVYEEELKEVGRKMGVNVWNRSKESTFSEGEQLTTIYDWHVMSDQYSFVILISACNPFLKVETINKFIEQFLSSEYNSLFSVKKEKNYFWDKDGRCINNSSEQIMNTKYVAPIYSGLHCLYASPMDLIKRGRFMGNFEQNNPALFVMDNPEEMFDIDYEFDFKICNILYKHLNE